MSRFHVVYSSTGLVQVPFTAAEEAAQDALEATANIEATRQATFSSDAARTDILSRLKSANASQIRTFVTNNVTDFASARTMLANILILIALDARQ